MARKTVVSLRVKIDPNMKDSIDSAIINGEYEDVNEFARNAFKAQLNPKRGLIQAKAYFIELIKTDPEIKELLKSEINTSPKLKSPSKITDEESTNLCTH